MDRRKFICSSLMSATLAALVRPALADSDEKMSVETGSDDTVTLPRLTNAGEMRGEMLYRLLGSTGEQVSAIGLGGSHIGKPALTETESVRLIHEAVDRGITFMDNSWDYNQGQSELRMGKALAENGYRDKVFLMTKIDGRTKETAMRQIDTSLERLKTDHVDLLQHHEVLRFDDPDRIFGEGGAMEAFLDAKQAGKIRYIGFTGHKDPHVHLYMLETAARRLEAPTASFSNARPSNLLTACTILCVCLPQWSSPESITSES